MELNRLSSKSLVTLIVLFAAMVALCIAHLSGHLLNIMSDDTGSAIVGVLFGVMVIGCCGRILMIRSASPTNPLK